MPDSRQSTVTVTHLVNGAVETWTATAHTARHQRINRIGANIRLLDAQGRVTRRTSFAHAEIVDEVITYGEGTNG